MLSLHLFEPRYKIMMQRILETTREFAYVPKFSNYQSRAGDVALVASLTETVCNLSELNII
jgi:Lon protease-like protein